jgi:hypothetical protein
MVLIPSIVGRVNLVTGEWAHWHTIEPEDATGMMGMTPFFRFGRPSLDAYAHSYSRHLKDLYLFEGLR